MQPRFSFLFGKYLCYNSEGVSYSVNERGTNVKSLAKRQFKAVVMKILMEPGTGEIEVKKSKFIATLKVVQSEEQAQIFINETRKKYWDAKHNCSAFVIGKNAEITRCSDDGEPAQTAGRPMLNVLLHSEVRNVACVVTRYFGGTLLGTGGLIKAYSDAVSTALENSVIGEEIEGVRIEFTLDYSSYGKVQYEFSQIGLEAEDAIFAENVTAAVRIPKEQDEDIKKRLIDITGGSVTIADAVPCTILKTAR